MLHGHHSRLVSLAAVAAAVVPAAGLAAIAAGPTNEWAILSVRASVKS